MASCEQWQEPISAYADGECTRAERRAVEAHLKECPACRQWLEQIIADQEIFTRTLTGRQADISDSVMGRVNEMSAQESEREKHKRPVRTMRLVELVAAVAVVAVVGAIVFPTFARSREKARQSNCLSNVKQIMLGMGMFAEDYDGRLPNALTWVDDLQPYTKNEQIFNCPHHSTAQMDSYAMVRRYSGVKLEDIDNLAETIIIYEAENGQPAYRHNGGMNVGYADGHGKWLKQLPPDALDTTGMKPGPPERNYGLTRRLKLAYDAACEVWVKHLQDAVIAAEQAFYEHGGFVLSSTMACAPGSGNPGHAEITGKVPTAEVAGTLKALAALGYVARREIYGEDLTDGYVTAAREVTQTKQQIHNLQQRRKQAGKKEKKQAEADLAEARSNLGPAQDGVFGVQRELALATITATIIEKAPRTSEIATGIGAAWGSFLSSAKKMGVLLVWLALYGLLLLPVILGVVIYRRWRE